MTTENVVSEKIRFQDLGLSSGVLKAISDKGFEEPSPIQAKAIPVLLNTDKDVIAQAQTGTGKTAAFGLPLIDMLDTAVKGVKVLILAPTRELAIQVAEEINSLKGDKKLEIAPVYGGQSMDTQLRRLRKGVDIVVGTPGRVVDHIKRKTLKLENIDFLVLDEADEMLNMGFKDDIELVLANSNKDKRTVLFSATMPDPIKKLAQKYMKEIESIYIKKTTLTNKLVSQIYYEVRASEKFESLSRIIDVEEGFYGVVFCKTRREVDDIAQKLQSRGYDSGAIHGDIAQNARERILRKFKKKEINIMVATDVAARGIDVNDLTHVINYSLPQDPESYVHRIGRTGRAGKEGTAITFITPSEYRRLMVIQRVSKAEIKKAKLPSGADIIKIKKDQIEADVAAMTADHVGNEFIDWASKMMAGDEAPIEVLSKVLAYAFGEELDPKLYQEVNAGGGRNESSGSSGRGNDRELDRNGKTRLFIAKGKMDGMNLKKLLGYVSDTSGVDQSVMRDVQVMEKFSFISVPFDDGEAILDAFKQESRGRRSVVSRAKAR